MTEARIPQEAPASTPTPNPRDVIADRIEAEIARLRDRRPGLGVRLDRATNLLLTHLSCRDQRVMRVRLGAGQATFLVNGLGGTVYSVDAKSWQCSCPDAHRRGRGCKHSLAAYLLWRVSRPAPTPPRCDSCEHQFPRAELVEVQHEHHNEQHFPGDILCRGCADRAGVPR